MIFVDTRDGSKELIGPLERAGMTVEPIMLPFADIAFEGKGEGGKPVDIGIEFKRLGELIGSIRDGRFAGHQLIGLTGTTDHQFDHAWLLIEEGEYKVDHQGNLCIYMGKRKGWTPVMNHAEFEKHLLTFELLGGIHVARVTDRVATVRWLVTLYRWWTDRALDAHTSHIAIHRPKALFALSPFRHAITAWPGIGIKTSRAVESHFGGSIRRAASATREEWASIETKDDKGNTRKFGTEPARKLVDFLEGGTDVRKR